MTTKQQEPGSKGRVIVLSKKNNLLFKKLLWELESKGEEVSPLQFSSEIFALGLIEMAKKMNP
jgi:hypothetical protein